MPRTSHVLGHRHCYKSCYGGVTRVTTHFPIISPLTFLSFYLSFRHSLSYHLPLTFQSQPRTFHALLPHLSITSPITSPIIFHSFSRRTYHFTITFLSLLGQTKIRVQAKTRHSGAQIWWFLARIVYFVLFNSKIEDPFLLSAALAHIKLRARFKICLRFIEYFEELMFLF